MLPDLGREPAVESPEPRLPCLRRPEAQDVGQPGRIAAGSADLSDVPLTATLDRDQVPREAIALEGHLPLLPHPGVPQALEEALRPEIHVVPVLAVAHHGQRTATAEGVVGPVHAFQIGVDHRAQRPVPWGAGMPRQRAPVLLGGKHDETPGAVVVRADVGEQQHESIASRARPPEYGLEELGGVPSASLRHRGEQRADDRGPLRPAVDA